MNGDAMRFVRLANGTVLNVAMIVTLGPLQMRDWGEELAELVMFNQARSDPTWLRAEEHAQVMEAIELMGLI